MSEYGLGLLSRFPESTGLFLVIGLASFLVIGVLYAVTRRFHWLMPGIRDRDVHTTRKPRVGGLGMWLVTAGSLAALSASSNHSLLQFEGGQYLGLPQVIWGLFAALGVVLVFGLLDDMFSLSAGWQLAGQFLAATMLLIGGLEVPMIRLPFDQVIHLNSVVWQLPSWLGGDFMVWSGLFIYLWVVAMINVMNFFDGLDGLAGSVGMTSSLVILLVSLRFNMSGAATLSLILVAVTAGFLPWNWYPSKLFMGTIGSQLLGLMLAVVAIISGAKVATAVLVLGIPLLDALIVVIRRLVAHQSPFKADQRHLHHRLLKIGLPIPWVVILVNVMVLFFGFAAVGTQQTNTKGMLILGLLACMAGIIFVTYLLERRSSRK